MKHINIEMLNRNTLDVAKFLLGKEIVTNIDGVRTSGYITEVEAYLGVHDRASHTFLGKKTKKNEMMFNDYGHIYVYTMHGHHCMNILSRDREHPEGVLIRAIEPNAGRDMMIERRGREINLTDGPGKLTKALGVRRDLHNGSVIGNDIQIYEGIKPVEIEATRRIGIDNKEEAVDYLYRFVVAGNPHVSRFRGKPKPNNGWSKL